MAVSKVALIRAKGILRAGATIQPNKLARLYEKGIQVLTGQPNIIDGLSSIFKREDRVGIKINTIGGKILSTRPEVSLSLANQLTELPLPEKNIVIWDRTNRELKEAGYKLIGEK